MQILSDTQHGILSVIRLIYLLYFIFALIGVASLLGTQAINFLFDGSVIRLAYAFFGLVADITCIFAPPIDA